MANLVEQVLSRKSNLLVLKVFLQQIYLLGFRFLDNKTRHKIFINYSSLFSGVRKRYLLRLNASALLLLPWGVLRKNWPKSSLVIDQWCIFLLELSMEKMPKKGKKKKTKAVQDTPRSDPILIERYDPPPPPREKVRNKLTRIFFVKLLQGRPCTRWRLETVLDRKKRHFPLKTLCFPSPPQLESSDKFGIKMVLSEGIPALKTLRLPLKSRRN